MTTPIQWTDNTFNCITGCTRVSEGCRFCYAEKLSATRLRLSPKYKGVAESSGAGPRWTGQIRLHPELLLEPLRWRPKQSKKNPGAPWMVFVNDMSDTFHPDVTREFLDALWAMFWATPWIAWQVLTKRPERMRQYFRQAHALQLRAAALNLLAHATHPRIYDLPDEGIELPLPNVWLGTSIEDQATADARIPELLATPAAVRFVSYEPALGPVDLGRSFALANYGAQGSTLPGYKLKAPDWVIVGGESGPNARPFDPDWACDTVDQCAAAGVACFVKQMGSNALGDRFDKWNLKDSHGGDPAEWPEPLRVRQWPKVGT